MGDERVDILGLAFSYKESQRLLPRIDGSEAENGLWGWWLIRVTTTVRIAKKVEMRPKDKARLSLSDTGDAFVRIDHITRFQLTHLSDNQCGAIQSWVKKLCTFISMTVRIRRDMSALIYEFLDLVA